MPARIIWFGSIALAAIVVVGLCIFLTLDRRAMVAKKLEENLLTVNANDERQLSIAPQADFSAVTFPIGLVNPFDERVHSIRVENRGKQTLTLVAIRATSNHISTNVLEQEIAPGRSGNFEVAFKAPEQEAAFEDSVVLKTNDPRQREVRLTVSGEVKRTVWTDPQELAFGDLAPNATPSRQLRVYSAWKEGLEITQTRGLPAGMVVTDEPLPAEELASPGAQSGRLLTITCNAEFSGNAAAKLTFNAIQTGHDTQVKKAIPFTARRVGRLSLSHDLLNSLGVLELRKIPEGEGREIEIFVEARGRNKDLELERVEVRPAFLQVELRPGVNASTSGLHRLHVKIPADAPLGSYAGDTEGRVTLHFTDREYPPVTFRPSFFITRD